MLENAHFGYDFPFFVYKICTQESQRRISDILPHKVRTRCTKYNGFLLEQEANNTKSFTLVRGVPSALAVVGVGTVLAQVMLVQ